MPTYEYECEKCKKNFDLFQSMNDAALKVCPKEKCQMKTWGKGKIKRLLGTGAGLIFKGSGFYITDYRSEGYKTAANKEAGAIKEAGGSKEGGAKETKEPKAAPAESKSASANTASPPTPAEKPKSPPTKA